MDSPHALSAPHVAILSPSHFVCSGSHFPSGSGCLGWHTAFPSAFNLQTSPGFSQALDSPHFSSAPHVAILSPSHFVCSGSHLSAGSDCLGWHIAPFLTSSTQTSPSAHFPSWNCPFTHFLITLASLASHALAMQSTPTAKVSSSHPENAHTASREKTANT